MLSWDVTPCSLVYVVPVRMRVVFEYNELEGIWKEAVKDESMHRPSKCLVMLFLPRFEPDISQIQIWSVLQLKVEALYGVTFQKKNKKQ
jgi:hypothetical protein